MTKVEPINGKLLREDRDEHRLSRIALLARIEALQGPSLGLSTLQRAENGQAAPSSLKWFAHGLGFPPDRYRLQRRQDAPLEASKIVRLPAFTPPIFDLSGRWEVFYLEDDVGTQPYLSVEHIEVSQHGSEVSGLYLPSRSRHPDGYVGRDTFRMHGITGENMIFGRYFREHVAHTRGAGVFQLLVTREGTWAEGVCAFIGDDGKLMVSLNLWIKQSSPQYRLMQKQAEILFDQHALIWKLPVSTIVPPPPTTR